MKPILKSHPVSPSIIGELFSCTDSLTETERSHRALEEQAGKRPEVVKFLRDALTRHHADPGKLARIRSINEALARQGFPPRSVFPTNGNTRKGNFAEVVLAEYLIASEKISLPVYRLRYNPNVDQSMKGDDVLAFDLDSRPMRVLIGESKFRGTPRRAHVEEIVEGLLRSHKAKIPASLQFVADVLYGEGNTGLARRVEDCQIAIARGQVELAYVGLLLGSMSASHNVEKYTPTGEPKRLVMISLGVDAPETLVDDCFSGLG